MWSNWISATQGRSSKFELCGMRIAHTSDFNPIHKFINCFQFSPVPFQRKPLEGLQVQSPETSMRKIEECSHRYSNLGPLAWEISTSSITSYCAVLICAAPSRLEISGAPITFHKIKQRRAREDQRSSFLPEVSTVLLHSLRQQKQAIQPRHADAWIQSLIRPGLTTSGRRR